MPVTYMRCFSQVDMVDVFPTLVVKGANIFRRLIFSTSFYKIKEPWPLSPQILPSLVWAFLCTLCTASAYSKKKKERERLA